MSETTMPEFSSDRPVTLKSDDKLNRAPFAEHVAGVLRGLPKGTGLIVGIHGPWGDGKTTVLNILKSELDLDTAIATVEFNPWRFTDEPSMLAGFFRVLAGVVRAKLSTKGEDIAGWIERVGRFAAVADDRIGKAADLAGAKAETNLEELRSRLTNALTNVDKRIVVLVDDIDRLDKHETHTLFRLIKACADFPNVCYVLAFDDVAVAKALGERYGAGDEASGRAFLEKIIQVPLKLPVAMREDLRSLCFLHIDQVIAAAKVELSKKEVGEFVSAFDQGVSIRLDTPRAAKRYGNALMFALPLLHSDINTVDLMLIEAVRAFYPAIYDCIRANHDEFSGVDSESARRGNEEIRAASLLSPIIAVLPAHEQKALKTLLKGLFPRLGNAYGFGGYGSDWLGPWAKAKRICSPDYCPRYFSYAVPKSDVRDSEIHELHAKAAEGKEAEVRDALAAYFAGGKARRVIDRLREREDDTDTRAVQALCLAIATNAKHIPNPPSLFRAAEPPSQAAMLISGLIKRLPKGNDRVSLAKLVVEVADPLWFGDECLRWLHVTDKPDKLDHNTLTTDELKQVGAVLVKRIKDRAASGEPLFSIDIPQEQSLLFEWWRIEGRELVQAHLATVFAKDPKNIGQFLLAMAPRSWGAGDVMPRPGDLDANQLKNIKLIYDLDALAVLIRKHLPGDFDNPQWFPDSNKPVEQRLAEQFMFVYNKWTLEGEPPDVKSNADVTTDVGEGEEEDEVE